MSSNIFNVLCLIWCFFLTTVLCLFEMCNHKFEMKAGEKVYVNSPYYPAEYPIGTSCRYAFKAPQDYKLKFTCNIKLNTPPAANRCLNEIFYFNREGSEILTESEYFCGTGKMNRKSFLNQAAFSYISTPYYKHTATNIFRSDKEQVQNHTTNKTETKTSTTKIPTTSEVLKGSQLTILTATTTAMPTIVLNNLLTTSFKQPLSSTTSLPLFSHIEDYVKVKHNLDEDKKVSNAFAYVVALLSNKINKESFATTTTTKSPTITTIKSLDPRPTSVLNFYDSLPVNMWHNGSHKISAKRVGKVVVGQDYTSSQPAATTASTPAAIFSQNTHLREGGGSFSCLVEVIEPQCECGWSSMAKIVGASGVAGINEFPSMAGIMTIKNQKIFCGASIIHQRYLLSAAHCFVTRDTKTPAYLSAVVGEHDLSMVLDSFYTRHYDIVKIITHEHFKATSTKVHNDIALLKTRIPIEWNRSVAPVCLPFYSLGYGSDIVPYAGQRVETAGWGTTSFGGLQTPLLLKTTLDVMSSIDCRKIVKNLPSETFCTYTPGRDTCQYDSGGALYVRGERLYAVGIVSYGYACATNQPSVNTRIASYLKWIRAKTPEAKYCTK